MRRPLSILIALSLLMAPWAPAAQNVKVFRGNGIVPPKKTTSQRDALTSPTPGQTIWNTTTSRLNAYNGSSWAEVGSGSGGVNYLSPNHDAEAGVSGWSTYADAAAATPTDCTGGSPTVTWTQTTSSPLRDNASYLYTHPASNTQGQGVATGFTIASADKAKPLQIALEYEVASGTWQAGSDSADSDVEVYVYDVTNSALIQPAGYKLTGGSSGTFKYQGTFQSASNSTSYRLCLHHARTATSAFTLKVDSVEVGPVVRVYGAPVGDWETYTTGCTGSWTTNTTYTCRKRRVGDSLEVQVNIALAGAPDSTDLTVTTPATIDTGKLPSTSSAISALGSVNIVDASTRNYVGTVDYNSSTSVRVTHSESGNNGQVNATNPITFGASDSVNLIFTVPITGWGSSLQLSQDSETRVVAFYTNTITGTHSSNGNYQAIPSTTAAQDTHAAWNGTTFTAPSPGFYEIGGFLAFDTNATGLRSVRVNLPSSVFLYLGQQGATTGGNTIISGSVMYYLTAGQTVSFSAYQDSGGNLDYTNGRLYVRRVSGPTAIAASETVAAEYSTAAGQSIPDAAETIVNFGTRSIDTHGSVSTGASWRFVAPTPGIFRVSAHVGFVDSAAWTAGEGIQLDLYKNGSRFRVLRWKEVEASGTLIVAANGSGLIRLSAGDYIDIRVYQNTGGALSLISSSDWNHVSIEKIGGTP